MSSETMFKAMLRGQSEEMMRTVRDGITASSAGSEQAAEEMLRDIDAELHRRAKRDAQ